MLIIQVMDTGMWGWMEVEEVEWIGLDEGVVGDGWGGGVDEGGVDLVG